MEYDRALLLPKIEVVGVPNVSDTLIDRVTREYGI
jgi:hypothetical protein